MSNETFVPPPPGWYDPGTNSGELRYWDGRQWTDDTAAAGEVAAGPVPVGRRKPRGAVLRFLLALVLWIGIWLGGALLEWTLGSHTSDDSGSGVTLLYGLAVYGALGTLVSYRKRDCLFLLIPLWNFIWTLRVAWRVAFLPYRDWDPRPEELKDLVPISHAGSTLYVRR